MYNERNSRKSDTDSRELSGDSENSGELVDPRINQIKFRRGDDGLYFSYFETKEEAFEALKEFAHRYKYYYGHTITHLCDEYQEKGIMFYPTQMGRWMKDVFHINVRAGRGPSTLDKVTTSFYIDREIRDLVNQIEEQHGISKNERSWFLMCFWRAHFGLEMPELLVIFEEALDGPVSVLFFNRKEEVRALWVGELPMATKKLIESLCNDGEQHGLDYIKQKCNVLGYTTLGRRK